MTNYCVTQGILYTRSRQFKKVLLMKKKFWTDFGSEVTDLPSIFCLTSIWNSTSASKSEAPKSTLSNRSYQIKILADLLLKLLELIKQIHEDFLI